MSTWWRAKMQSMLAAGPCVVTRKSLTGTAGIRMDAWAHGCMHASVTHRNFRKVLVKVCQRKLICRRGSDAGERHTRASRMSVWMWMARANQRPGPARRGRAGRLPACQPPSQGPPAPARGSCRGRYRQDSGAGYSPWRGSPASRTPSRARRQTPAPAVQAVCATAAHSARVGMGTGRVRGRMRLHTYPNEMAHPSQCDGTPIPRAGGLGPKPQAKQVATWTCSPHMP
jgi:hypothetical protein